MFREEQKQHIFGLFSLLAIAICAIGCRSPYHSDRAALGGGLLGAGAGAIIGEATGGNAASGALIGAGLGAIGGAVVGSEMDEAEARNRAMIEQTMGRQIAAGAISTNEVVSMSSAGVDDSLIINHIKAHGMISPLSSNDLIMLKQQGVSEPVIAAMQAPPAVRTVSTTAVQPVVVEEHYYGAPYYVGPGPYYGPHRYHHRPGPSFGVIVH